MATRTLTCKLIKVFCLDAVRLTTTSEISNNFTSTYKFLNSGNFIKKYSTIGENKIPVVTYEEIKKLTTQSSQLLIDVRESKELQETGRIQTSINIPISQIEQELGSAVNNATFKTKYGCNKPEKNSNIIFYCRSGKRSQQAAELAKTLGYWNSKNYLGSWTEWSEKEGLHK